MLIIRDYIFWLWHHQTLTVGWWWDDEGELCQSIGKPQDKSLTIKHAPSTVPQHSREFWESENSQSERSDLWWTQVSCGPISMLTCTAAASVASLAWSHLHWPTKRRQEVQEVRRDVRPGLNVPQHLQRDRQVSITSAGDVHVGQTGVYDLSNCPLSSFHVVDKSRITVSEWHLIQTSQILWKSWKRRIQRHQLRRDTAGTLPLQTGEVGTGETHRSKWISKYLNPVLSSVPSGSQVSENPGWTGRASLSESWWPEAVACTLSWQPNDDSPVTFPQAGAASYMLLADAPVAAAPERGGV